MKIHQRLSALTILAALLLSGCSQLLVDNYRYGTIQVQAFLMSGEPAEGVDLLLYRTPEQLAYAKTDANGEYTFTFAPNGSLGVVAFLAPNFSTDVGAGGDYRDQIEVPNGEVAQVVFTRLLKTASTGPEVSATVAAGGESVEGAGVGCPADVPVADMRGGPKAETDGAPRMNDSLRVNDCS